VRVGLSAAGLDTEGRIMLLGNHRPYGLGLCVLGYLLPGWLRRPA
jgi:hypothetical protein